MKPESTTFVCVRACLLACVHACMRVSPELLFCLAVVGKPLTRRGHSEQTHELLQQQSKRLAEAVVAPAALGDVFVRRKGYDRRVKRRCGRERARERKSV
jgi:hypothetical protein